MITNEINNRYWITLSKKLESYSYDKLLDLIHNMNKNQSSYYNQVRLIKVNKKSQIFDIIFGYKNFDYFCYLMEPQEDSSLVRILQNNSFSNYHTSNIIFSEFMSDFNSQLITRIADHDYQLKYVFVYNMPKNELLRTNTREYNLRKS